MTDILIHTALLATMAIAAPVELPDGFEIVDVSFGFNTRSSARMNNCGEIVFTVRLGSTPDKQEIFHYDNGKVAQLTDDEDRDAGPELNDLGAITWSHGPGNEGAREIILYENGNATVLAQGTVEHPVHSSIINNVGHMIWQLWDHTECHLPADLVFFDGTNAEVVVSNGLTNQGVALNDIDEFAWTRYDFPCGGGFGDWTSTIRRWSEGEIMQFPATGAQPQGTGIDNTGRVAWIYSVGDQQNPAGGVEVWDNGEVTLLDSDAHAGLPKLNDRGDIAYGLRGPGQARWNVFLQRDGTKYQITADETIDSIIRDINEDGEVVWAWHPPGILNPSGIRMMRRIRNGDVDFDDDIDLDDVGVLARCMTGPVDTDRLCACRFVDVDHDRDVDMIDFAYFQRRFGLTDLSRDCCEPQEGPGCNDPSVQACVCNVFPYCCDVEWADVCVNLIVFNGCGSCP